MARVPDRDPPSLYHWVELTSQQRQFMASKRRVSLWRDANQKGKSYALALMAHDACRGVARYAPLVMKPPLEVIVAGTSWEQMEPLMHKCWDLAPHEELDPKNGYDLGRGITGKPPRLVYTSGPGKGSVINFATYRQGPGRIAGGTKAVVILDEPPTAAFYGEAYPRIVKLGGRMRIGFTPTMESPNLDYLWTKVDAGEIEEMCWGMSEEACQLEESPGVPSMTAPFYTQAQIDEMEMGYLAQEREMRMGRSRYPVAADRYFMSFDDNMITTTFPPGRVDIAIGIDHGSVAGSQIAVLIAVALTSDGRPLIWVLGEAVANSSTKPEEDAQAILDMLERAQLSWENVDLWVGDRRHGGRHWGGAKSNDDLSRELARLLGCKPDECPFYIETAKKPKGSVWSGTTTIHACQQRGHFEIHPSAEAVITSFRQWQGADDEYKHAIDALRYGAIGLLKRRGYGTGKVRLR